ncbi:hypothetical protein E5355_02485 [Bacteroides muris (ex Afrizal et al. 2022)]|jgi:hypothetical protein|uniref:Uncharacterized protein n=1 Tax=Bacteroides muris (ex Afrizal et al. 2022) TaxID=2516960 RepID=A0A4V3RCK3_9BACE|nr:hypothetical protein E5355_02485 [Bacteroides muris (ex Afrizal et al. 2022)]
MLDSRQIIADRYELLKQLGRGGFSEERKYAACRIEEDYRDFLKEMMQSNLSTQEIHIRKNTRVNVRL